MASYRTLRTPTTAQCSKQLILVSAGSSGLESTSLVCHTATITSFHPNPWSWQKGWYSPNQWKLKMTEKLKAKALLSLSWGKGTSPGFSHLALLCPWILALSVGNVKLYTCYHVYMMWIPFKFWCASFLVIDCIGSARISFKVPVIKGVRKIN